MNTKKPSYLLPDMERHLRSIELPQVNDITRIIINERHLYTVEETNQLYKLLVDRIIELKRAKYRCNQEVRELDFTF